MSSTSTRFINLPCDYKLQQKRKNVVADYKTYRYQGQAVTNNTPGFNVLPGQVGPMTLSSNFADIDSFLKGTYQNNLENPRTVLKPNIIKNEQLNFFNRSPVYLPQQIDAEICNRPHLI